MNVWILCISGVRGSLADPPFTHQSRLKVYVDKIIGFL